MQLAVSVVLLTMGVLFIRNMTRSMTMSPGFDADGTLWASVRLVPEQYPHSSKWRLSLRRPWPSWRRSLGLSRPASHGSFP